MTPLAPLALARSGAILVPLSAPDACLRFQRCAPSPPSGGLQERRVHGIADGELASEPDPRSSSPSQREIWTRREPAQAAQTRNGRRFALAQRKQWLSEKQELFSSNSRSRMWISPTFASSQDHRDVLKVPADILDRLIRIACRPP